LPGQQLLVLDFVRRHRRQRRRGRNQLVVLVHLRVLLGDGRRGVVLVLDDLLVLDGLVLDGLVLDDLLLDDLLLDDLLLDDLLLDGLLLVLDDLHVVVLLVILVRRTR
jgi:hypothetical protein